MEGASRYKATRLIGRGGAADVFEAVATGAGGFQRRVVLKRLRRENAEDGSFSRGFIDEARIASQLHHANIVSVLDFGLADGLPFQVLELVDGLDLGAILDLSSRSGSALSVEVALHIGRETAHALAYAHQAEDIEGQPLCVVHRDVTPGNILISFSGDVKLGDFGIARAAKRLESTQVGYAKGKLEYMAPEQARADEIDHRADLFSLGCVLHQMLAGYTPLYSADARREVELGRDPRLSPELPADVRAILERATRTSPEKRFADAEAMERELGDALAKRMKSDARAMLRDVLSSLRAPAKKRAQNELAELFDVELVMRGGDRRFESRVTKEPTADPLIGSVLDSYRIVESLGSGGMARVYRAEHVVMGTQVAIKLLRSQALANPLVQKRFRREAQIMSRIAHPNVAKILDFGTGPQGVPFLVMELIDGLTLRDTVKVRGPLPLPAVLSLARDMAAGLDAIHAHGIVHRDLKPGNVMITAQGAKILDFGLAILPDDHGETRFTAATQLLGTPPYMAPEQIESAKAAGPPADLYALGAVVYFAFTGRAPFTGRESEIIEAKRTTAAPELPPADGLEHLVRALMASTPGERPANARMVIAELASIAGDEADVEALTPATRVTEVVDVTMPAASIERLDRSDRSDRSERPSPTITAVLPDTSLRERRRSWPIWSIPAGLSLFAIALLTAVVSMRANEGPRVQIVAPDLPAKNPAVAPAIMPVPVDEDQPTPPVEEPAKTRELRERRAQPSKLRARPDEAPPAAAPEAELGEEELREKLQRVSRTLRSSATSLAPETYEPLEARYLELRAKIDRASDALARRALAKEIDALAKELER